MDQRPDLGLASVVHRGAHGVLQLSIRRFPSPLRLGEALFAAHWPMLRSWQELKTRTSRYEREGFLLNSKEIDWCYRFWRAGWPVAHLPVMAITHHAGGRDRGDLMAQLSHSRLLFAAKHYGPLRRKGIRAALALGHIVRICVFTPASHVRPQHAARMQAERAGLQVVLGRACPPLGPYAKTISAEAATP
jgi:hypothetical protein